MWRPLWMAACTINLQYTCVTVNDLPSCTIIILIIKCNNLLLYKIWTRAIVILMIQLLQLQPWYKTGPSICLDKFRSHYLIKSATIMLFPLHYPFQATAPHAPASFLIMCTFHFNQQTSAPDQHAGDGSASLILFPLCQQPKKLALSNTLTQSANTVTLHQHSPLIHNGTQLCPHNKHCSCGVYWQIVSQWVSELLKLFLASLCLLYLEHVEADRLAQRMTMTHNHQITNLHISAEEKCVCTYTCRCVGFTTYWLRTGVGPNIQTKSNAYCMCAHEYVHLWYARTHTAWLHSKSSPETRWYMGW